MRPALSRSQSCAVYGRTSITAGLPGSTPACASWAGLRSTCRPLLSVVTVSLRLAREASIAAFRLPADGLTHPTLLVGQTRTKPLETAGRRVGALPGRQ